MTDAEFHSLFTGKPAVPMGPSAVRKTTADRFARIMYYYVEQETEFQTEFCSKRLAAAVSPPLFSKMLEA